MQDQNLYSVALACIAATDIDAKLVLTRDAARRWRDGQLAREDGAAAKEIPQPGLPIELELVPPRQLARRSLHTAEGHAALIHSICHIEFNAVNLAWDAVYRFRDMPEGYYHDWVRIAEEEAHHFELLNRHLNTLGYNYGDFPAHNGLWEMACDTDHDPMVRMALVPRVLEARGLDVTPGIIRRLEDKGDHRAVEILELIHREEIGHVESGSRWFRFLCDERGLEPETVFRRLLQEHMTVTVKKPLHREARRRAGFSEAELDYLDGAV
jgi:uncharacterized ferritin-like protein (DUF455 family)